MSAAKTAKILNPRIKLSKSGRPYMDVADLVKALLERIEKGDTADITDSDDKPVNGNGTNDANVDSRVSSER